LHDDWWKTGGGAPLGSRNTDAKRIGAKRMSIWAFDPLEASIATAIFRLAPTFVPKHPSGNKRFA
jgi:hypothetical protein